MADGLTATYRAMRSELDLLGPRIPASRPEVAARLRELDRDLRALAPKVAELRGHARALADGSATAKRDTSRARAEALLVEVRGETSRITRRLESLREALAPLRAAAAGNLARDEGARAGTDAGPGRSGT